MANDAGDREIESAGPGGRPAGPGGGAGGGGHGRLLRPGNAQRPPRARNFRQEELAPAIGAAHARGAKAYLTLNVDLAERELGQAARILELARQAQADGVLIRDPALLALRPEFPELEFHFSTQTAATSSADVAAAAALGAARVVLAREMTLAEIARASAVPGIGTEVFVQGALCFSVSGRCLLSSWAGGHSGNRGTCASPCRVPWTIDGREAETPLSMHDLATTERLAELRRASVAALKIEGRLKSAAWVRRAVEILSPCPRLAGRGPAGPDGGPGRIHRPGHDLRLSGRPAGRPDRPGRPRKGRRTIATIAARRAGTRRAAARRVSARRGNCGGRRSGGQCRGAQCRAGRRLRSDVRFGDHGPAAGHRLPGGLRGTHGPVERAEDGRPPGTQGRAHRPPVGPAGRGPHRGLPPGPVEHQRPRFPDGAAGGQRPDGPRGAGHSAVEKGPGRAAANAAAAGGRGDFGEGWAARDQSQGAERPARPRPAAGRRRGAIHPPGAARRAGGRRGHRRHAGSGADRRPRGARDRGPAPGLLRGRLPADRQAAPAVQGRAAGGRGQQLGWLVAGPRGRRADGERAGPGGAQLAGRPDPPPGRRSVRDALAGGRSAAVGGRDRPLLRALLGGGLRPPAADDYAGPLARAVRGPGVRGPPRYPPHPARRTGPAGVPAGRALRSPRHTQRADSRGAPGGRSGAARRTRWPSGTPRPSRNRGPYASITTARWPEGEGDSPIFVGRKSGQSPTRRRSGGRASGPRSLPASGSLRGTPAPDDRPAAARSSASPSR